LAETTCYDRTNNNALNTIDMGMKYTGKITYPRNIRVAYVEQEPPLYADVTVADALLGIRGTITTTTSGIEGKEVYNNNSNDNSNNDKKSKSVYAVVRRYKLAAENVDSDRKCTIRSSYQWKHINDASSQTVQFMFFHFHPPPSFFLL
jgi:ATPase subunit of ABC transporter with duplicated ATPase domains